MRFFLVDVVATAVHLHFLAAAKLPRVTRSGAPVASQDYGAVDAETSCHPPQFIMGERSGNRSRIPEVQFQCFAQIVERLLLTETLTCDIDFHAVRDKSMSHASNRCG